MNTSQGLLNVVWKEKPLQPD